MPPAPKVDDAVVDDAVVDDPKNPRMDEGAPAPTGTPDLDLLAGSVQWATRADFRNIDSVIAAYQAAVNSAQAATKEQLRTVLVQLNEFKSYVRDQHPKERQKIIDGFNKLGENIGTQIDDAITRVGKGEEGAASKLEGLLDGHLDLLKGGAKAASQKMSDISDGNKAGVKTLADAEKSRISRGVTTEKTEMAGRAAAEQARTAAAGGAAVGDISARGAADVSALQQQQATDVSAMQQLTAQERAAAQAAGATAQEAVRGAGKGAVADFRKAVSEARGQIAPGEALGRIGAGGRALEAQIDKRFPGAVKTVTDTEKAAQKANTASAAKALKIGEGATRKDIGRITALAEAHQKAQAEGFDSLTAAQQKTVGEGTTGLLKDVKGRGAAMAALFGKRTGEAMGMLSNAFAGRITDIKKQFGDSLKKRIASFRQQAVSSMMNNTAINRQIAQMESDSGRQQASAISEVTRQQAQAMTNTYSQLSGEELGAKRGDMQALNQLQQQRQGKIEDVNRSLGVAQLTADERANLAQENLTAAAGGRGQAAAVQAATTLQGIRAREGEQAANRARSMVADREGNITKAGMQTLSMKGGLEKAALGEAGAHGRAGISGEVGLRGRTLGDIGAAAGRQQQAESQAGITAMGQVGAGQRGALGQVGAGQRGTLGAVAGQLGRTIGEEAATGRAGMGLMGTLGQAGITAGAAAGRQLMSLLDSEQGRNTAAQLGIGRDQLAQVASALQQGRMQAGDLAKMGLGQIGDLLKTGVGLQATTGVAGKQTEANMLAQQMAGEGRSVENIANTLEDMGLDVPPLSTLTDLLFRAGLGAAPPMLVADRGVGMPNLPMPPGGPPEEKPPVEEPPVVEKPGDKPVDKVEDKDKPFNIEQKKWDLLGDEEKMQAARAHHGVGPEDSRSEDTEAQSNVHYATAQVSPTIQVTVNNLLSGAQQPTSWAQQRLVDDYQQTGQVNQEVATALEQDPQSATSPPGTSPSDTIPPPATPATQATQATPPASATPAAPTGTPPQYGWRPGQPPWEGPPSLTEMTGTFPEEASSISLGPPGSGGEQGPAGPVGQPNPPNRPINIGGNPVVGGQPIVPGGNPQIQGPPQVVEMEGNFPSPEPSTPSGGPTWPPRPDLANPSPFAPVQAEPHGAFEQLPLITRPGDPPHGAFEQLPLITRPGVPRNLPPDGTAFGGLPTGEAYREWMAAQGAENANPERVVDPDRHRPSILPLPPLPGPRLDPAQAAPPVGQPAPPAIAPDADMAYMGKPVAVDANPERDERVFFNPEMANPGQAVPAAGAVPAVGAQPEAEAVPAAGAQPVGQQQNPHGPPRPLPIGPTAGMGFPRNPITTNLGNIAGMERARQSQSRGWESRRRAEARKAGKLAELQARREARDAGGDPGVHPTLTRVEDIRAQKEAQRDATRTWSQKVHSYGGTPGSVALRLSRMAPAEREAYYRRYPAAQRDLAGRVRAVRR